MAEIPFVPAEIAAHLAAGQLVHLNPYLVLFMRLDRLVRQCRRCVLEETQAFIPASLTDEIERLAQFIFQHQHKDPS